MIFSSSYFNISYDVVPVSSLMSKSLSLNFYWICFFFFALQLIQFIFYWPNWTVRKWLLLSEYVVNNYKWFSKRFHYPSSSNELINIMKCRNVSLSIDPEDSDNTINTIRVAPNLLNNTCNSIFYSLSPLSIILRRTFSRVIIVHLFLGLFTAY